MNLNRDKYLLIILISLVMPFLFYACASLQQKEIKIPEEIASKGKIVQIPKEKQVQEKNITVIKEFPLGVSLSEVVKEKHHPAKKGKAVEKVTIKKEQEPVLASVKNPFRIGEKIRMDLYYIGIKAATLTMEVKPDVELNGERVFHFQGISKTSILMSLIYKVYDVLDTYIDSKYFIPMKMTLTQDESKQNVSMVLVYDHKKEISSFWKKRIDSKGEVTEIRREDVLTPYAQDIISSLYYVRTHDFKVGDKLNFVVHDQGKNWNMTIDVEKEEYMWTPLGHVDTLLLHPTVERNGEKYTKGKLLFWVTNDPRKIPVKFQAKVKIGSMHGVIKDYVVPKDDIEK